MRRMKAIKRYMALAIVFVLVAAGCILLMLDFPTVEATWLSVAGSFLCIGAGVALAHVFIDKNMLPE